MLLLLLMCVMFVLLMGWVVSMWLFGGCSMVVVVCGDSAIVFGCCSICVMVDRCLSGGCLLVLRWFCVCARPGLVFGWCLTVVR